MAPKIAPSPRLRGARPHALENTESLLDELLSENPRTVHESMSTSLRTNRESLATWREEFMEEDDATDDGAPTEFPTRVG